LCPLPIAEEEDAGDDDEEENEAEEAEAAGEACAGFVGAPREAVRWKLSVGGSVGNAMSSAGRAGIRPV
jgi:hypothetical protein